MVNPQSLLFTLNQTEEFNVTLIRTQPGFVYYFDPSDCLYCIFYSKCQNNVAEKPLCAGNEGICLILSRKTTYKVFFIHAVFLYQLRKYFTMLNIFIRISKLYVERYMCVFIWQMSENNSVTPANSQNYHIWQQSLPDITM